MKTVRVDPLPNGYVRATLEDGSTMTMETDQLPAWLRDHSMPESNEHPTWYARIRAFFNRKE